jgi:ATP-dependent DNA helicase RecG
VGTHALIQKSVQFRHLALAIVDEQHRFGTAQRRALARKGDAIPHFLSMTATPIPRTLALTLYGDLDISVIDELPPGRAQVTTRIVSEEKRPDMYTTMRHELAAGRQAYVICPRIEEPDPTKLNALMAKSAKAEAQRLQKDVFPEYTVGLLHGAMTPTEKDAAMRDFEHGNTHILVATSVVEVGVNVPNATVIIIEGAERFGLSQLHQLRGRVQRSSHAPYCFLAPDTKSALSLKRLRALEKSSDGFELAEADLQLRGAGDLFGSQQWGVSDLGMEALKNPRLIEAARIEAQTIVEEDPTLAQHPALALRAAATSRELHGE